ncbi:MAG: AsmA family protein [Steroidobacteraceae bacterium]
MGWRNRFLIALAAAIGLVLIAALAVALLVNANAFRGSIQARVQQATGHPCALRGPIKVSWFPWLALQTGAAELGNPSGFEGPPLARWRAARIGARLFPLLRGALDIDRVRVEGLEARLIRDVDGQTNWRGIFDAPSRGAAGGPHFASLAGIELKDAAIEYLDRSTNRRIGVRALELTTGAFRADEPLAIESRFELDAGESWPRFSGSLATRLGLASDTVSLAGTRIDGSLSGPPFTAAGAPVHFAAALLQLARPSMQLAVPSWALRLGEAQFYGSTGGIAWGDQVRLAGSLALAPTSLRALLANFGVPIEPRRDATALETFSADLSYALDANSLVAKPLAILLDGTRLEGSATLAPLARGTIEFALHGARMDLTRYLGSERPGAKPFEFPTAALKKLRARGDVTLDEARVTDLQMTKVRLRFLLQDGELRSERP